ncbi:hypothetical protein I3843_08G148900, partial [Carya illinoinensis]
SNKCCIYRIPNFLRKLSKEAYTPEVISIDPFYHGNKRLETMEKLKLKYFEKFLQRIDFKYVEDLVNDIKLHEERVHSCYAETIKFSSDDFVKLILVDGIFIIELFCEMQGSDSDNILLNKISEVAMMLDMQLLENQLPFFVLEKLFSHAGVPNCEHPSFLSLAVKVFENFLGHDFPGNLERQQIRHFVDLTKAFFLSSSIEILKSVLSDQSNVLSSADHLYSASQLYEAGVKFKVISSKCFLDLKFTNKTLEIPCMNLYNTTETTYRNIIAFEQCHYRYHSDFTDYIVLLSFLINTPKDADLLIRKGIIINWLPNSDAVASLFTNLFMNVVYDARGSVYCELFKDLNAFYENTKHTRKATLKRDYFGTPWKTASTVAAVILLLLTLIQTICSIIQV